MEAATLRRRGEFGRRAIRQRCRAGGASLVAIDLKQNGGR
jgi:hypothetical protein